MKRETEAERKVTEAMKENGMLRKGARVIAGVSGGADSVFLFFVLKSLCEAREIELRVIHVHHGIRGSEADGDEAFVRELCQRYGIPCEVVRRDIPSEAAGAGYTLEEAGRLARREIFERAALCWQGAKIALAHHRNDLAETVLFRLARGTGIHGLAAMQPVSGIYLRPLLGVTRAEIEASLAERHISWREDSTNAGDEAARNRIRHRILPLIEKEINEGAAEHLAQIAEQAAQAASFIEGEAAKRAKRYVRYADKGSWISRQLLREPELMQTEIVRLAIRHMTGKTASSGCAKDFSRGHIRDILLLFGRKDGAEIDLPCGLRAVCCRTFPETGRFDESGDGGRNRCFDTGSCPDQPADKENRPDLLYEGGIFIGYRPESSWTAGEIRKKTDKFCETDAGFRQGCAMHGDRTKEGTIFIEEEENVPSPIPENQYTKWIDCDKIKSTLAVRTRQSGDFLTIDAAGHTKSLSDYFTNTHVPKSLRDHILLVADGHEIVWAAGLRLGYRYRIGPDTDRVLRLRYAAKAELQMKERMEDERED